VFFGVGSSAIKIALKSASKIASKIVQGRVLSGVCHLGEKSQVAKGHKLPRGVWGNAPHPPPRNVLK